jgi:signal transduction histidine kinase
MTAASPRAGNTRDVHEQLPTTLVMSLAAVCAALVAMFGESDAFTPLTVAACLVGLVPWALLAGGVAITPAVFAVLGLVPAVIVTVVDRNPGGMFPALLVVVAVARSSTSRILVACTVGVAVAAIATLAIRQGTAHETGLVYFAGGVGISWLAGEMLRRQERLTDELVALHGLDVEHAAIEERTRIAREVHDVVAHSLTVVMLHLTGARRMLRIDPERADEALARAEAVGRESLDSVRGIVGLLRSADGAADDSHPLPGIADLAPLVDGYRSSGARVTAEIRVDPELVDPATALTAYRVVQESLTNAVRHAPGASCSVRVEQPEANRLRIEVENDASDAPVTARSNGTAFGHGIRGMTERVRALGGEATAEASAAGGWRVRADLPLRRVHGLSRPLAADDTEDGWTPSTTGS